MRRMALRRYRLKRELRRIPLFPFVPLVPAAIFIGSLAASIRALVRVRRLERRMASPAY